MKALRFEDMRRNVKKRCEEKDVKKSEDGWISYARWRSMK